MIVAGYDPSIASGGLAVIDRSGPAEPRVIEVATIRTDSKTPLPVRLKEIFAQVGRRLREHHVSVLAVEEQRRAQVGAYERGEFQADNSLTLFAAATAMSAAFAYGVEVIEVSPQQVKKAVLGRGKGSKDEVKAAVRDRILRAGIKRFSADAADALATAIAGEAHSRLGMLVAKQERRRT